MGDFLYKHEFLENVIKATIKTFDNIFQPYKEMYTNKKEFPIYIHNTGDEVFMSNLTDIGETKRELYEVVPRMVLDVKSISIDSMQITSGGIRTRIGAYKNNKLTMGVTSARRAPINILLDSKVSFSKITEYFTFVEYFICVLMNHTFTFEFDINGVRFTGNIKPVFEYDSEGNMDLEFDSTTRNRILPILWEIDAQMPAYNIYKLKNISNLDLGFKPGIDFEDDGFDPNDPENENDGSCNGHETGGMQKIIHRMYENSYDEKGFRSKTIIPNEKNTTDD